MDRSQLLNDEENAIRLALDGRQSTLWTAMPGIVQSVNMTEMTCVIQPAIQGVVQDEAGNSQFVNLPLLIHVPINFPSAGGFIITFPMVAGDEVLVIIASRCIDAWWQSGGVQPPMELRMHDLSDGFAIPGPRSQPNVVSGISSTNLQIRNDAGTCYIEITPAGQINLVSPAGVTITGALLVSGPITAPGGVSIGGVPFTTHRHTGVTTGASDTGGPV